MEQGKEVKFYKWQGLGNDFIILIGDPGDISETSPLATKLCDRHYGIGGDGLIYLFKGSDQIINMVIFNADGTLAGMCGNGIRCLAAMAYRLGWIVLGEETIVKVGQSLKKVTVLSREPYLIKVDMGKPTDLKKVNGQLPDHIEYEGMEVNMGNPHLALILPHYLMKAESENGAKQCQFSWPDILAYGPELEHASVDTKRAHDGQNVEFVIPQDKNNLHMRVWERGVGETLACGTGACASFVAAHSLGLCGSEVVVHLPGGRLAIAYDNNGHVMMTGPAEFIFEASVSL